MALSRFQLSVAINLNYISIEPCVSYKVRNYYSFEIAQLLLANDIEN